jgi:dolichol-phosphate mannosyltransferase
MIYVVLPAYNEAEDIAPLLEQFADPDVAGGESLQVVVVDDGSTDNTAEVVRSFMPQLALELVSVSPNQGLANAIRTGYRWVAEHATDPDAVCVTMDADNSHSPQFVPAISARLRDGCDVVIASRFAPGGGMQGVPFHRQCLSIGARLLMRLCIGVRGVTDYSNAYRGIRVLPLRRALDAYGDSLLAGDGFAGVAGLLVQLDALGLTFAEVPFQLDYGQKQGDSKMRVLKTTMGYLKMIARCHRLRRHQRAPE